MAVRTHAPQAQTTCSVGRLIDYFVTHANEHHILKDIEIIKDTVVSPHSPVAATIRADIYQTRTLQQVVAPKLPQCDPVHERVSWEEAQTSLRDEIKWKVQPCRYQDDMQENYVKQIGSHTAGMQMSDIYSVWSATNTVQMMSEHTRDPKEIKKYLGLGRRPDFGMGTDQRTIRKTLIGMQTWGSS